MPSSLDLYRYWVANYTYQTTGDEQHSAGHYSARVLIHALTQHEALTHLSNDMIGRGITNGQYQEITSLQTYLEESTQPELRLVRYLQQISDQQAVVLIQQENIDSSLPAARGDLILTQTTDAPVCEDNEHLYAVIDAAVYQQAGRFIIPDLLASSLRWQGLFKGETQVSLEDSAPYLIELSKNNDNQPELQRYIMNADNRSELSLFIQSEQPFEILLNHLRKFAYLKNELTQAWAFFRFYHPNTLTTLLNTLSDGPLANFMQGINAVWFYGNEPDTRHIITIAENIRQAKPAPVTINRQLCEHFEQQAQQRHILKAINFIKENLAKRCQVNKSTLPAFVLQQTNLAYLQGLTQQRAILYYVAAKSLMPNDEVRWQQLWESACLQTEVQEIRAHSLFAQCDTLTTKEM
ncbi:hypothetical protein AM629_09630 [Photorhabdus heterorhabditis]|uniref:DUF4123 domain-containing protein n=1 Tax=Photorhabdus heterorhabditis TaxID=880156 RepID=A0ABR5KCC5_9GAMM|nr:DUF4123 domain-containing protein [Photorhabdus heterorhabditis]KOY62267.1 hypothetical protein AM629_09630 [Photorhabdus heterorhabditis]